jgi:hypothetical protein
LPEARPREGQRAAFVDIGIRARDIARMLSRSALKAKKFSAWGIAFSRARYG